MSQDYPESTAALFSPEHVRETKETQTQTLEHESLEDEEHQHHAGCRHGKQTLPVNNKFKIGRNDPCYCGSGKKYKKCCSA